MRCNLSLQYSGDGADQAVVGADGECGGCLLLGDAFGRRNAGASHDAVRLLDNLERVVVSRVHLPGRSVL